MIFAKLKILIFTIFSVFFFMLAQAANHSTNNIFFECDGKSAYNGIDSTFEIASSFYIGKSFIEQEGEKYKICEQTKTTIYFSEKCDVPDYQKRVAGNIDLILKKINIWKVVNENLQGLSVFTCRQVRGPRN
jgi:hypothetical protein